MESDHPADKYIADLERLLDTSFGARGDSLRERLDSVRNQIPEDLQAELDGLTLRRSTLSRAENPEAASADFVFTCGKLASRLTALSEDRAAAALFATQVGDVPPELPENQDLDAIARFMVARDKFVRKVAELTLKSLVVIFALLVVGLVLGII